MIIGIDASRAIKQNKTGVEWYAYYVISELVKLDTQNQFVLYIKDEPNEWLKKIGERQNVKIKRLRWPFKFLWTQGRLSLEMLLYKLHWILAFAGMTKERPDVLFIPASAMPIIHSKNTVAVVHDVGFMPYPDVYNKWQRLYLKWSTKFAVRHASKIIAIAEFSKQEIVKYFAPSYSPPLKGGENLADKIFVTHLGYDTEKFRVIGNREEINNVLVKYCISQPFILSVGRLEKKKNIKGIVDAFAKISHEMIKSKVKLVLAGRRGKDWEEAEHLIKEHNLQNEVIELGYVPEEDLPYLYNAAAALVFPSRYEGFGLPILEAFACGAPVVCSNAASLAEVAGEAVLYFDANDVEALTKAMQTILTNENLRQELINRGRERAKSFSWEKCAMKTLEILGY